MTRKNQSKLRARHDSTLPPPPPPATSTTTSSRLPKPILRPVSDPLPGAPTNGRTTAKGSKGPFTSLTFAAGTALGGGASGARKQRKGVLGFFHKKDSSESSSSTGDLVSSGSVSSTPGSVSSGLPTPTSPVFPRFDDPKMPKGSIGRGLWGRLTGTVRESRSSSTSVRAKSGKDASLAPPAVGLPVEFSGSLSHAPPFPWKRSTKGESVVERPKPGAPKTLSSVFGPLSNLPPPPSSSRADKPRTLSSTGPLSRAPLGNVFLGPLSTSPERRPSSMDQAAQPEMALDGLEAIVASGLESLRVRTLSRVEPRSRVKSIADFTLPAEEMPRQTSLSVINKANRTLLDLVARLDQSATSSPESSPVKPLDAANPADLSPLLIRKRVKPADSAQSLLFLRKPKSTARRLVPKTSRPSHDPRPTVDVVMEKAGVAFSPGAAPVGFGQTVGVEQVVQSHGDAEGANPLSDVESHIGSDVPDDLQDIISEKDDGSSRGSGCWSEPCASPTTPALGLPPPPPPNRISPRRNGPLTLEVPPPLRIASWHSRSQTSSDDTSALASPDRRDSSTFDFTGEIQQLSEDARASFFDTLHETAHPAPVFPSMQALTAAGAVTVAAPKSSKSSSSTTVSGRSTPLGALNREFKFGSRPPSSSASEAHRPRKSFEAPIFRVSAPTPLPPDSPRFADDDDAANTTFGAYDPSAAAVVSIEDLEVDDVLPDETYDDSKLISFLSESSTTRRGHRHMGHGDSTASFASFGSISSVGHVIHPGSRHPFSFDYSQSVAYDSLSPDASLDSGTSSTRTRKESDLSVLTQSSFGAPLVDGKRLSDHFEFSSFRRGGQSIAGSRHGYSDSVDSVASTFSFHAPDAGRHHRRSSSIASIADVGGIAPPAGPPISLFNQARPFKWKALRHARNESGDSAISSRSSMSRIPRATGRPDWARHRAQQSSADSSTSFCRGGGRPGLGDRMFSPDQAVPLFPISASPNGSPDDSFRSDSFQLERMLQHPDAASQSDSSDSVSVDECRTSIDSGFPTYRFVHEREPSLDESAESVFGAGDDSFLRPFVPSGPRPLSGLSQLSSDGDGEVDVENDTFAFKHSKPRPAAQLELPIMDKTRGKERPLSALSSNASDIDFDDTFAFKDPEAAQIVQPARYTLPVLRAEIHPRGPPPASPLRKKRKDDRDEVSCARKARLVSSAAKRSSPKGLQERASLEDSCFTGNGEDASFNSSDLAHFHQAFRITAPVPAVAKPRPPVRRKAAVGHKSRPQTLILREDAPDTPPLTSSTGCDSLRLSLELTRLSLDAASPSASSARKPKFVPGHRSRASGPSASVHVQETIQEEHSDGGARGSSPPGLSRSQSSSPLSDTHDFPSPIFLLSREPDIVAFDDDPSSYDVIRGWRAWERDAQFEFGRSQASWMDTDHSQEEISHFTPPKKLSHVQDFIQDSARSYKRLSASFLKHKRSSSLSDSRLHASPYYVDPEPAVKTKIKARGARVRPTSIKTKFAGADLESQLDSARLTSAKFAAFAPLPSASTSRSTSPAATLAMARPASPPPSIAVFAPVSPLRLSFLSEQTTASGNVPLEKESLAKKARRVSSNVRRERLGWGRRKTSVDHGAGDHFKAAPIQPKRSSLQVHRDAPAVLTKQRPASLDNKENVGGSFVPSVRPRSFRLSASTTTTSARVIRA